jgi:hypothetical protein
MNPIVETTYNQVFELFTYLLDTTQFPEILDDWRSYADQVEQGIAFQDDCDGFAMTIAELLVRRSVPPESIRLVICETETNTGHLVCMVDGFLLDYRQPLFLAWDKAPYTWFMSMAMSEPGIWKTISIGEDIIVTNNTIQNYLSVSIPSTAQAADISDRANGSIVICKDLTENGITIQSEELVRVTIDRIDIYEGGRNQSIVLSGYNTRFSTPKDVPLNNVTYRTQSALRTAVADTYLEVGDTVIDGENSFVAESVTYSISTSNQQMDVQG